MRLNAGQLGWKFWKVLVEADRSSRKILRWEWFLAACLKVARMHFPGIFRKCPALLIVLERFLKLFASIGLSNAIICSYLSRGAIC